jgi:protein-S-isoprenylcysteine O-methyltransferase Ste14
MKEPFLNGLILILPILLSRFLLLALVSKEAVKRAAFFPPTEGIEKPAYIVNILTSVLLLVYPFFLKIYLHGIQGWSGLCILITGLILYSISIIHFSSSEENGFARTGLYGISRNPMYVAYFIYFLGCSLLTRSWTLLVILIIFQISVHFLIISEERWCKIQIGEPYLKYMEKVNRYL